MMVMILATAIVRGFKNTISDKMFGFWGHIHITGSFTPSHYAFESNPISQKQPYYPHLDTVRSIPVWKKSMFGERETTTHGGIHHIQVFANKEGIIKTKDEIEGIILRGIGTDYDWSFLQRYIIKGDTLRTAARDSFDGILISETTAKRLKMDIGDKFEIYFVQNESSLARRFIIKGIYKTGLEEYDRRFALVDIRQIQQLNNWRPFHNYGRELRLEQAGMTLLGFTSQTLEAGFERLITQGVAPMWDDSADVGIVVSEQLAASRGWQLGQEIALPYFENLEDSATLNFKIVGLHRAGEVVANGDLNWNVVAFVSWHQLQRLNTILPPQISGFEVFVSNLDDLDDFGYYVNDEILVGRQQYASTIRELEPSIFDWLNLTDMNERIILILMILVSIINMITSLMILILERTNMIGTLKALGASNWEIRKIFLYYAAYIIGWGLLWGNVLGIGLALVQQYFGVVRLPEDLYYVPVAPIELQWLPIVLLNLGTLLITLLVLILPSYLVSKIEPVRAIRFK